MMWRASGFQELSYQAGKTVYCKFLCDSEEGVQL